MCNNVGFIGPCNMVAVLAIFGVWKPYFFSDICQICVQYFLVVGGFQ